MAIKKQITFEGLKYNLDNRDRIAAATAVYNAPIAITHAIMSGSTGGKAVGQHNYAFFVADRKYRIMSIKESHNKPSEAACTLQVQNLTGSLSSSTDWVNNEVLASAVNLQGACNTATGSVTGSGMHNLNAGNRLGVVFSAQAAAGNYDGVISVILQAQEGSET
jgi:hypothetical protein|tara:strand:- start:108 stop:599 length:492 start_codon:yes stop_codon:yes gene_type:complete